MNIHPCLWFDGQALEAAEFYCSLFKHSRISLNTGMVVNFELDGQKFMGLNGGPAFTLNPSISLLVISESDDEIENLFNRLSDGGKILMPLGTYDWSEKYAFCQDRFGLAWQIMKGKYSDVNQKITPTLLFVGALFGRAEAAVKFYTGVFPKSSINGILLYSEEEGKHVSGTVKHSQFILDEKVFMAMDGYGNHSFSFNEAFSFVVECKDQATLDQYWEKLTEDGGEESMCGWLKDKFGVSWQIIPAQIGAIMSDPDKAPNAMAALMKMKKIDINTLLNA